MKDGGSMWLLGMGGVPPLLLVRLHGGDLSWNPWSEDYQISLTQFCLSHLGRG